jgi:hypothetical protein
MITFADSFGGFNPEGLVIVVSLPLLAWAILAPTPGLALAGGLLFVPGVAVWAALLVKADVDTSPTDTDVQRAYPLAASAAVLLALAASYTFRGNRRPRSLPSARGRGWTIVRTLIGVAALLAGAAIYFTLEKDYVNAAVVASVGPGWPEQTRAHPAVPASAQRASFGVAPASATAADRALVDDRMDRLLRDADAITTGGHRGQW